MPVIRKREIHFVLLMSKQASGIDITDYPTLLARRIKPPPLAEGPMSQLAKELFPPGLCDPSFVIPLDDPEITVAILELIQSKQIPESALTVRASINTQWDHDGVDLPPHVLKLVR